MTALFALALGYGYAPGLPGDGGHALTREEAFGALPPEPEWRVDEAYQALSRIDPWRIRQSGVQTRNDTESDSPQPIRFHGVLAAGRQRMALIEVDGKVKPYRLGDRLPNDAEIVEITDMILTVDQGGRRHRYQLYQG